MKILILFLMSFMFTNISVFAAPEKKAERKVAQETKVTCAPLEKELTIYKDDGSLLYNFDELGLLRNSIFYQYGYSFKNTEIQKEIEALGCPPIDSTRKVSTMGDIDKANVKQIKEAEEKLRNELNLNFNKDWKNASINKKVKMLKESYCYLFAASKTLLGIINFGNLRKLGRYELNAMMDVTNPTWIDGFSEDDKKNYKNRLDKLEFDSTSMSFLLEYPTKGTWYVGKSDVFINIGTMKDAKISIDGTTFNSTGVYNCKLLK